MADPYDPVTVILLSQLYPTLSYTPLLCSNYKEIVCSPKQWLSPYLHIQFLLQYGLIGRIYMKYYFIVAISYSDLARHYSDVTLVGTNHDADTAASQ